jgi:hypothetical protein
MSRSRTYQTVHELGMLLLIDAWVVSVRLSRMAADEVGV